MIKMRELFRNRSYTLLFTGNMVSEMGNVLFGFVAGLYVQDLTGGNPIILGLFMALGALVRLLFSPIAGVLVDRWDKVKIIYLTDYIRGLMFVAVAYVFFVGVETNIAIAILLGVTVASGIIGAFFGPAITSATPEIVGLDQLQAANGANSIIQSTTMIMGVILGAAAFGLFDFHVALLLNGISFMLSGFSEMFIKAVHKKEIEKQENPSMLMDMKIGFRYLKENDGLLRMMFYSLMLNFAFSPLFSVGIPFLFRTELGKGAWDLAWINIAFGIAMMIGGLVVGGMVFKNMARVIKRSLIMLSGSFILTAIVIFLLTNGTISYGVFYVLFMLTNISLAIMMMSTNVPLNTSMVKIIDPEKRGRVFSTISAISGGAVPLAIFLSGVVIGLTSVTFLALACSAILLIPTIGFIADKKVGRILSHLETKTNEDNERVKQQKKDLELLNDSI
jgi:MFS family permease